MRCAEHGVRQLKVSWADEGSRFTALFEAEAIEWLREASVCAVARRMGLSWDQAAGIQRRAVKRGLARRRLQPPRLLGVDETSFRRRHEYVTVVNDLERGVVAHVADGRDRQAIDSYFEGLGATGCSGIKQVAMNIRDGEVGLGQRRALVMGHRRSSTQRTTLSAVLMASV